MRLYTVGYIGMMFNMKKSTDLYKEGFIEGFAEGFREGLRQANSGNNFPNKILCVTS